MRIIHILGSIGHDYGGPAYSVPLLVAELRQKGFDAEIASVVPDQDNEIIDSNLIPSHVFPVRIGGKIQLSPGLFKYLLSLKNENIVIHLHTIWNMIGFVTFLAFILNKRVKLIISTRGYLLPAAIEKKRIRKKIAWYLFVKKLLKISNAIHVTSEEELDEVSRYIKHEKVFIIKNIIPNQDANNSDKITDEDLKRGFRQSPRNCGTLSRIVPHKGIHKIIKPFALLSKKHTDWSLLLAGPIEDINYYHSLQKMISKYNLTEKVKFVGQLNGEDKEAYFSQIELFILLSDSENYGMSVAEALLHNVPVIVTKNVPWPDLVKYSAGWWIEDNEQSILSSLDESLSTDSSKLEKMGENGSMLLVSYDKEGVMKRYINMYQEVTNYNYIDN